MMNVSLKPQHISFSLCCTTVHKVLTVEKSHGFFMYMRFGIQCEYKCIVLYVICFGLSDKHTGSKIKCIFSLIYLSLSISVGYG